MRGVRLAAKKNKFSFARSSLANEKFFWEELREVQLPKRSPNNRAPREAPVPVDQMTQILPADVSPDTAPTIVRVERPPSSPLDKYLPPGVDSLTLPPKTLSSLHEIVSSKHAADILNLGEIITDGENSVFPMAGLHKLAQLVSKKGSVTHTAVVLADHRFEDLLGVIGESDFGSQAPGWLVHVFWSIKKLGCVVEWEDRLRRAIVENADRLTPDQIACVLYCLAGETKKSGTKGAVTKEQGSVIGPLVGTALSQLDQFDTHSLVSVGTSLARIGRIEKPIMAALSERILPQMTATLAMDDLVSVMWSFTSLGAVDRNLIDRFVSVMESRVTECSRRNLVDSVWALAKAKSAISDSVAFAELFRFTMAPAIRNHLPEMSVRELCTVLWSFACVQVWDADFYNDLVHALRPRIREMNAHDIVSMVWALGSVGWAIPGEMRKSVMGRVKELGGVDVFSAPQIARMIGGMGGEPELVEYAKKCMHILRAQNLVEIVSGLKHHETLPFLHALEAQTHKLSGRDAVQVLAAVARLEPSAAIPLRASLVQPLLEIVQTRFNCAGRWIPSGFDLVELVGVMAAIPTDRLLQETVFSHLATVYKSPSFTADLFLRLLENLANLPEKYVLKKLLLLQEKGIKIAFYRLTERLMENRKLMTTDGAMHVIDMYSRIGYCDERVEELAELLVSSELTPTQKVSLATACSELAILPDWVYRSLEQVDRVPAGSVVAYMWSLLVAGENIEEVVRLVELKAGPLGDVLRDSSVRTVRSQQVAMSLRQGGFDSPWVHEQLSSLPEKMSSRADRTNSKSIVRSIDKFSSLVVASLAQLGVKHKGNVSVLSPLYTVTASLGEKSAIVDVAGPEDLVAGSEKYSGTKVLKNIQLARAGYSVLNLGMKDIQRQLEVNSLSPWIADVVAPFSEAAKQRVTLKRIPDQRNVKNVVDEILGLGRI